MLEARSSVPVDQYDAFLDWFAAQTTLETELVRHHPVGLDFVNGVFDGKRISLNKEIAWLTARIASVAPSINRYLELSDNLTRAIWSDNGTRATECLDRMEAEYGLSMHLLGLRIAAEQHFHGLEAQKNYVEKIKRQLKRGILGYVAHFISVRNEPTVTRAWYSEDVARRIKSSRYQPVLKTYFFYRLLGVWPSNDDGIADILRVEQSHSDIDLYETFVALVHHVIADRTDDALRAVVASSLRRLDKLQDPRILKARLLLGEEVADRLPCRASDAASLLLAGKLRAAYRRASRGLRANPAATDEAIVMAFARAGLANEDRANDPRAVGLWANVVKSLSRVVLKRADFAEFNDDLQKIAYNFGNTPVGAALVGVAASEATSDPLDTGSPLKQIALNLPELTYCDFRAGVSADGANVDACSQFILAARGQGEMPADVHVDAMDFGLAARSARMGEWTTARERAAKLARSTFLPLRARAALLSLTMSVKLDDLGRAIAEIGAQVAKEGISPRLLPHVELLQNRRWSELREFGSNLDLPIVLDLALQATSDDRIATHRRFAYDLFLKSHGCTKASQLDPTRFDLDRLSYFLRNVAVPSVLDMSEAMKNTKDIQIERREICSMVVNLDPERGANFQSEILEITDRLAIDEGLRLVDSSRIHVDTDAIESWAIRELRDGYLRYRNLVSSGVGVAEDFEIVLAAMRKQSASEKHMFAVPDNEADELLVGLIKSLLHKFTFDPAHGLDSYLSRRIRHGSIVGFLRGPVEEAHLVTLRDEASDTYADNIYWLERLTDLTEIEVGIVSQALRDFAKAFDDRLIALRDRTLQIQGADFPEGIFDLSLYSRQYHLIRSAIKDYPDFGAFFAACIASFWGILDTSLWKVRTLIRESLRAEIAEIFNKLRETINSLQPHAPTDLVGGCSTKAREGLGELNLAISSAHNTLQAALEDAAEWFTRTEIQVASRIYTLEEAVHIAVQSALARLRRYEPNISFDIDKTAGVQATDLSVIADIILITLGNACERSGITTGVDVSISVALSDERTSLTFQVVNEVAPGCDTPEVRAVLDLIRDEIKSGSTSDLIRKERRSGLRKLGSLSRRFATSELTFGFAGDDQFQVVLSLPFELKHVQAARTTEECNVAAVG